jgi:hypothetical protein
MRTILGPTAVLLFVLLVPAPARAQELATSFDQLRVLIKSGDMLSVTDGDGKVFRGRMTGLSSSTMDLVAADGARRALTEQDVRTIRMSRPDPLGNGAKTGFAVGAGLGLFGGLAMSEEFGAAAITWMTLVYGGIGSGIGVGIDALFSSTDVIFSRPAGKTTLRITPVLGPRAQGARLSIAF